MEEKDKSKSNQKYEERLGTAPMLPLILKMALPAVIAQFVNMLYSLVDRMYIARIEGVGTDALAGIGITGSIIILISAFSAIVSGGGAPLAAIALGAGDRKKAEKIIGNGFSLLVLFTILTSGITYAFMEPILRLIGASDKTLSYGMNYLSIYLIGTLFVQLAIGLNPFITSQGRPGIGMCSILIGAILNIILDPIFIFVFDLGVSGAAIATVISQFASCAWVLIFLFSKKATLRIKRENIRLESKIIAKMVGLGIAPFVMTSTEALIGFVLNGTLAKFGDIYVSALTVMQSILQFISVPIAGFAQGVAPVISYNFGHRNKERVKKGFNITLAIMVPYMFVTVLIVVLFPHFMATLFTPDKELIKVVTHYIPVFTLGMSIFGLQRACQNTFVALGQAKVSLFIALLRKVFLLVPLALILPNFFDVTGVYLAESVADATAAILCTIIFYMQFPKILKQMDE